MVTGELWASGSLANGVIINNCQVFRFVLCQVKFVATISQGLLGMREGIIGCFMFCR